MALTSLNSSVTLIPPLIAILLAFMTKRVLFSLFVATVSAVIIALPGETLAVPDATLTLFLGQFKEDWIIYALFFALLVGSIIRLLEASNAVISFVDYLSVEKKMVRSKRSALFMGMLTGVVIFIESSLTALIVATVIKPFSKQYGISRQKVAYLCDTTSAPICSLLPINGWGALLIGLLSSAIVSYQLTDTSAVALLFNAVFFNFYAWVALVVLFFVILKDINIFSMKTEHVEYDKTYEHEGVSHRLIDFIAPLLFLIGTLFVALYLSGSGNIMKGDGSKSLFIAVVATLLFMFALYVLLGEMKEKAFVQNVWQGIYDLAPIVAILLFAFTFSSALKELGTAHYLGSLLSDNISIYLLPSLIFLLSAGIAFATGTSWGTFAIMIPIAMASIDHTMLNPAIAIGAVISGGVFGDHTSPISDTTILSSLAAECDHISHVKTQLPYALISGSIAFFLYILATFISLLD